MKPRDVHPVVEAEYEKLLDLLARTGKYLEGVGIDASVLSSYKHLLRYLRARPESDLSEIIGKAGRGQPKLRQKYEFSEEEIRSMNFERILEVAANEDIPRKAIERIASVRFGMTRGGLSTLRSRDALVEKLRTLIRNEGTHDAISRAASSQSPPERGN